MMIQFHCSRCDKLLHSKAETAGKKAKCPACGHIMQIPAAPAPAPQSAPETNPFTDPAPASLGQASPFAGNIPDPDNPYAAPTTYSPYEAAGEHAAGELIPTKISFGDALNTTWAIFTRQMGLFVLLSLVMIGMVIAAYAAAVGFFLLVGLLGAAGAPAVGMIIIVVVIGLLIYVGLLAFGSWIIAGIAVFMIKTARADEASISDIFSGGPYLLRLVGYNLLVLLIHFGIVIVCVLPGMIMQAEGMAILGQIVGTVLGWIVDLFFILGMPLIVDRNMGIIEAIQNSMHFMQGNKLTTFLLLLVTIILGFLVVGFTCGIGILFFYPFLFLLVAVIYLQATGQRTAA